MGEIVKICTIHGELTIDKVYPRRDSRNKNAFRCKFCWSEKCKRYRSKNKELVTTKRNERQKTQEWKKSHVEYMKKYRNKLYDSYVKYQIAKRSGLKTKDIPDELVQIKKISMQIKRILKERGVSGGKD